MGKKKKKKQGKKRVTLKKYNPCWKTKKKAYPSEDVALAGLAATWRHRANVDINDMNVYECYFCHKWHIGHKSKYKEYLERHKPLEIAK